MSAWKQFERDVARLLGGKRFWANSGEAIDCESDGYVAQAKLVKTCSLAALTALAEMVERQAALKNKAGVVAIKLRRGRGRSSPMLLVVTAATWERMNGANLEEPQKEGRTGNPYPTPLSFSPASLVEGMRAFMAEEPRGIEVPLSFFAHDRTATPPVDPPSPPVHNPVDK
jgi:hypothetical protein